MKTMRLQGIGMVEGTEAKELKVGEITRWNFGGLERVTSVEFTKTGKSIKVEIEYISSSTGEIVKSERTMRANRLVNIVASGNTKLTSNASFEMVEEAPEAEEVIEAETNTFEMKKSVHEVSYRVTDHGTYVEVMLFVIDVANDITLVSQNEGTYSNMKEAKYLIDILEESGNNIEFVETVAYTG
jgi:hypothetical protein